MEGYREKNRIAWNKTTIQHQRSNKEYLLQKMRERTFDFLGSEILAELNGINFSEKLVSQICCNNGRELIALVSMGAKEGVGFDISDEVIGQAQELAHVAGQNCSFLRTDILDNPGEYNGKFDFVYISAGTFCWFESLTQLIVKIKELLKPGGIIFVNEIHPVVSTMAVIDEPGYNPDNELNMLYSYFKGDPWIEQLNLDYVSKTKYEPEQTISFQHTLEEVFSAFLDHGLTIKRFKEFPKDVSAMFRHLEKYNKLPMSYVLIGQCT